MLDFGTLAVAFTVGLGASELILLGLGLSTGLGSAGLVVALDLLGAVVGCTGSAGLLLGAADGSAVFSGAWLFSDPSGTLGASVSTGALLVSLGSGSGSADSVGVVGKALSVGSGSALGLVGFGVWLGFGDFDGVSDGFSDGDCEGEP
ncbi:hypothetical protein, partial [Glutamicibacter uratoxydans]|uniref:hypothetical protein n=1 Tax=Glutamicibacter uratoxydans TaxID=43667 RepID=UPI001C3FF125